jgi:hypothetical protein
MSIDLQRLTRSKGDLLGRSMSANQPMLSIREHMNFRVESLETREKSISPGNSASL